MAIVCLCACVRARVCLMHRTSVWLRKSIGRIEEMVIHGKRSAPNEYRIIYFAFALFLSLPLSASLFHLTFYITLFHCAKRLVIHHFNATHTHTHTHRLPQHSSTKTISCFWIRYIYGESVCILEIFNNRSKSRSHFHMKWPGHYETPGSADCSHCNCHISICILYSSSILFVCFFRLLLLVMRLFFFCFIHVCLSHCFVFSVFFYCVMRFYFDF